MSSSPCSLTAVIRSTHPAGRSWRISALWPSTVGSSSPRARPKRVGAANPDRGRPLPSKSCPWRPTNSFWPRPGQPVARPSSAQPGRPLWSAATDRPQNPPAAAGEFHPVRVQVFSRQRPRGGPALGLGRQRLAGLRICPLTPALSLQTCDAHCVVGPRRSVHPLTRPFDRLRATLSLQGRGKNKSPSPAGRGVGVRVEPAGGRRAM